MSVRIVRAKIVELVKCQYPPDTSMCDIESEIFYRPGNIRLTYKGNMRLARLCNSYAFDHDIAFCAKHLIAIARELIYPYYLTSGILVLYSETDAAMVSLHGGVREFIESLDN